MERLPVTAEHERTAARLIEEIVEKLKQMKKTGKWVYVRGTRGEG
jgi:hypothetical protein